MPLSDAPATLRSRTFDLSFFALTQAQREKACRPVRNAAFGRRRKQRRGGVFSRKRHANQALRTTQQPGIVESRRGEEERGRAEE
jgi:hypothetical protein